MSVSIPATIFENHNALMLPATSNLWALLWSSPCQVHWRTIGRMMVGQFLSNQLWCGVGLSCCWWFDQRRRGSCETFRSFDQRALLCGKTQNHVVVARLQFRYCCLTDGKLVKIPNSQITQPRQVTSVLAPLTLQLHTHKFLDQGPRKQNTNTTI